MERKGYKQILKQKSYVAYMISNVINRFGDSLDSIAFTWIVYAITGNAFWSALIFGVNRLPTVFLQPFMGVLVDKYDKRIIIVCSNFIRGLCVLYVGLGVLGGWITEWGLLWITLLISTAEAVMMPASSTLITQLLDAEDYEYGVSLSQGLSSTVELVGLASAGVIIGLFGVVSAVFIDMITFFISGIIVLFLKLKSQKETKKIEEPYFVEFKKGFSFIKENPLICYLIVLALFLNGVTSGFNALEAPMITEVLKSTEIMLSVVGASFSLGGICGAIGFPKIREKISDFRIVQIGSTALLILYFGPVLIGHYINSELIKLILVGILGVVAGIEIGLLNTFIYVTLISHVSQEYLGRVTSIMVAVGCAAMPVAAFIISGMVLYVSVTTIFIVFGLFSILALFTICSKKTFNKMVKRNKKLNES